MNSKNAIIYTESTNCQDCYKCIRHCPVKAIQILDGHASIIAEKCIMCGTCVDICPSNAKKIRDDMDILRIMLKRKEKIIISLAPSYKSEFKDISDEMLIKALRDCGFAAVSETALGAQEVTAHVAKMLKETKNEIIISSACPVVVDLIKKHYPEHGSKVTDIYSPLLAHSKMIKEFYGHEYKVVFVGPCIAKKSESDQFKQYIDLVISFDELVGLIEEKEIKISSNANKKDYFFEPQKAMEGVLYPVDGGMIAGLKDNCSVSDADYMSFSGINKIMDILDTLDEEKVNKNLFLELLACDGGCVNGPCTRKSSNIAFKRRSIINNFDSNTTVTKDKPKIDIQGQRIVQPAEISEFTQQEIAKALRSIGKYKIEDQMNCGSCGYDSCIEFAKALLQKKAETSMCVSYMKKLASKKANALLMSMPSGVIIVDEEKKIVESNLRFAQIAGEDIVELFQSKPGLEGANFAKIMSITQYLDSVLETDISIEKDIRYKNSILHIHVFPIESHCLVGVIFQDITEPSTRKEHVINNAQNVIKKNLETVQQIAYLLGENAAESESTLNSIINSFSVDMETDND